MVRFLKPLLLVLGSVALVVGIIGIVLPVLPTTPFFILTLVCYTKSSERFKKWFVSTWFYKRHLENFILTKSMSAWNKFKVLLLVSLLIFVPILLVDNIYIRITLALIILGHYLYFLIKVKTTKKNKQIASNEKKLEKSVELKSQ